MAINLDPHQHTLEQSVSCSGIGLHSGRTINLTIKPAEENNGIRFRRADLHKKASIPARMEHISDTTLATTLGSGAERISTTEHLLAALHGAGIDNANIELDGHEVPIMDGSAACAKSSASPSRSPASPAINSSVLSRTKVLKSLAASASALT